MRHSSHVARGTQKSLKQSQLAIEIRERSTGLNANTKASTLRTSNAQRVKPMKAGSTYQPEQA